MRALQLLLLLSLLLLSACGGDKVAEVARPALVVQPVSAGLELSAFAGEVHARVEPQLAFRIGGKIARRLVDAGQWVKAGQPLAELDSSDVRLQDQAAGAQLSSAKSDLQLAKNELDRYKNLLDSQLVSRSLYDTRLAQYQAAAAKVRQAAAQANVSGNQADYAVLRAPASGLIAQRLAEAGQVVAAGQPIFVLAADGDREVLISVPENALAQFTLGRDLIVELWAAPGKRFPGKLRELSPAADPLTRTYAARVSFQAQGVPVDIGQSARVYAPRADSATLTLPLSAIYSTDHSPAVWVVQQGRAHLQPVRIGAYGETEVPVLAGIHANDWVVVAGVHLLREGMLLTPVDHDNRRVDTAAAPLAVTAN
jgi:multidrug efflux system membrane fusion protein